jgi:hypothetical protein
MTKKNTQFKPGQSGNPGGRPKGTTSALRQLLAPAAPELINKAVTLALAGDVGAIRLCMERLLPPLRPQDEVISIERLSGTLAEQGQRILNAMAEGKFSPDQAAKLLQALAGQARLVESDELEKRISILEKRR